MSLIIKVYILATLKLIFVQAVLNTVVYQMLIVKSDGQEKSTKILISWQELKNQFLSFFVHRWLLGR